jgi:hypothetical protein
MQQFTGRATTNTELPEQQFLHPAPRPALLSEAINESAVVLI